MSEQLTIDDCMSPSPYTVGDDEPAMAAQKFMEERRIRHLPVMKGDDLVGLFSMRDVSLMGTLKDIDLKKVTVGELMSTDPYSVQTGTSLRAVAIQMNARKYGSAVVKDGNKVVGLFTTVDALRVLANIVD